MRVYRHMRNVFTGLRTRNSWEDDEETYPFTHARIFNIGSYDEDSLLYFADNEMDENPLDDVRHDEIYKNETSRNLLRLCRTGNIGLPNDKYYIEKEQPLSKIAWQDGPTLNLHMIRHNGYGRTGY